MKRKGKIYLSCMTDLPDTRRSDCPISFSLDIFGDRWTLLVLRDLLLKRKRHFRDLAAEEGIATNILTDRLRRLEAWGILRREPDPADGRQRIYLATERGLELTRILVEIAAWGAATDPKTGAPDGFVEIFETDREAYIQATIDAYRSEG